ncbi:MAG: PIN domain-containing protein, partial [Candidatus Anstonellales archaeon]
MPEVFVCDTSVIVNGRIIELVRSAGLSGTLVIPAASIAEIEHQANCKREVGFAGLAVLKRLREIGEETGIVVEIRGERPDPRSIEFAKKGEIDALIRGLAKQLGAVLITGDTVQAEIARVE